MLCAGCKLCKPCVDEALGCGRIFRNRGIGWELGAGWTTLGCARPLGARIRGNGRKFMIVPESSIRRRLATGWLVSTATFAMSPWICLREISGSFDKGGIKERFRAASLTPSSIHNLAVSGRSCRLGTATSFGPDHGCCWQSAL